jgi:hippurate hydrolase
VKNYFSAIVALTMISGAAHADKLRDAVVEDYDFVFDLYKFFHQNPELSFKESKSAAVMARELNALGFTVTTGIGDDSLRSRVKNHAGNVPDGVGGHGLAAVMENGDGPTLMIRADMDALPLKERTGLPYASNIISTDHTGQEVPVMHACAHDSHMAIMIGTARRLVAMKDKWSGTLILIGQPAEEVGLGARAMLEDELYKRFPTPDYVLALHTEGNAPAGTVTYTSEWARANVDSVDITVRGIGTHGSAPQYGIDPIVIAAQIVTALQTLVSREIDPLKAGVVTVGSLQAGFKHNIISDEAKLKITVRSYEDDVRQKLLDGIKRITMAQAMSAGVPANLAPIIEFDNEPLPSAYNEPNLTARVMAAIGSTLGVERVVEMPPVMGGDDFSFYGRTKENIPTLIFGIGGADPEAFDAYRAGKSDAPPSNHSPFFAPMPEPTLKTGVHAMTLAALDLLGRE